MSTSNLPHVGPMDIAILGAGAMGCFYGAILADAGHDVVLIDVRPEQLDTINRDGLVLEATDGRRSYAIPALRAEQVSKSPDLLIIFTKAGHTLQAIGSAKHLISDKTWVMTVQNGLGNLEAIESCVPRDRIIVGITTWPCDSLGPGRVRSPGIGYTRILSADAQITPGLELVCRALDQAGLNCEISPNVYAVIWEKLAFNAAMNSVTAITGFPCGGVGATKDGRELTYSIAKEVVAVAQRKGVPASETKVIATLDAAFRDHGEHMPSMLQDLRSGRQTEVEAIMGAVVREAETLGCLVPTTRVLYQLVRAMEQVRAGHQLRDIGP